MPTESPISTRRLDRTPGWRCPARSVVPLLLASVAVLATAPPAGAQEAAAASDPAAGGSETLATETIRRATAGGDRAERAADRVVAFKNERYREGEGIAGLCDIYLPSDQRPDGGFPMVVLVHGGGWISGDKWTLEGYSRRLAEAGLACLTINYRLAPQHRFPLQVDDVRSAMLYAAEQAGRFGFDLDRIGLFGYSAGGHLALMVAGCGDEPAARRVETSRWPVDDPRWDHLPSVHAVCVGGPPCDFQDLPPANTALAYFLGGSREELPEVYRAASPITHISADDPITQIIHGSTDLIVPVEGSRAYHAAQVAAGVDSRHIEMPRQGHVFTFVNPETTRLVVKFFVEQLIR